MRRLHRPTPATLIASVALAFALPVSSATASGPRIPSLAFSARAQHVASRCSESIPDAFGPIEIWVYVNGDTLKSPAQDITHTQYFVGDGTLVRVQEHAGNGPVCARVLTWLRSAHVVVRLQLLL